MSFYKLIVRFVWFACISFNFLSAEVQLSQISRGVRRLSDGSGYLLLAPSRFLSGTSNRICLSRFGQATSGIATAQVDLRPLISVQQSDRAHDSASSDLSFLRLRPLARSKKSFLTGNGGCFDIMVPKSSHSRVWLHLRIRFDDLPHYMINTRKKVHLQHGSHIVVIQTDKSVYRSGETVKFRVLLLRTDLTPLQMPIYSISIEAPSDLFGGPVKVMQWNNVSTQMGLIQLDYTLDKYALKGDWKITVQSSQNTEIDATQNFYVTDYELPNFYITTLHQKNIVLSYKQIVWTVCARFMYGEAVKGKLHIKVTSDSYEQSKPVLKTLELTGSVGCHNFTARTKLLGFNFDTEAPTVVIAEFAVQEEGTRRWKNTTAISHITKHPLKVEFVNKNKMNLRPGLPYTMKVRVTNWNNHGVENARVRLCKKLTNNNVEDTINESSNDTISSDLDPNEDCEYGFSDGKGFWLYTSHLPATLQPYIKFKVTVVFNPLQEFVLLQDVNYPITSTKYMKIWSSASMVHLDIGSLQVSSAELRPGSRHNIPIFLTLGNRKTIHALTMHYGLVTRGGILFRWSSSTLCPGPLEDDINDKPLINVSPNKICYDERTVPKDGVFKVNLPVKISHQMCPHSYVIVYFMHEGELIVASKYFRVLDCFFHKVYQKWIPSTTPPSSPVRLRVRAPGPALCATGVSDIALKHVSPHLAIQNHILRELKYFVETRSNITLHDLSKDICFKDTSSLRPVNSKTQSHFGHTLTAFRITGLDLMSDLLPDTMDCPPVDHFTSVSNEMPAELMSNRLSNEPRERSNFPETWLWDLHLLHANGSLDIFTQVPDTITRYESQVFCVSRSGVATSPQSQESILKVFQPFFAELDLPKGGRRGESIEVLCKVYNYMDSTLPVSIYLDVPSELIIEDTIRDQITCIPAGRSMLHRVLLKPQHIGTYDIRLMARVEVNFLHQCPIKDNRVVLDVINNAKDTITKTIVIHPEGKRVETFKSALLCADDLVNETGISWTYDRIEAVKDSEMWTISVVGDIIGPMSLDVERLLSLPVGCGEQNMAMLSSNLVALDYMHSSGHLTPTHREIALKNLMIGYQRQLRFRLADGSFSAFGSRDGSGSTWLTAFTLKGLSVLKLHWNIGWDDRVLNDAMVWLIETQMENGCFRNEGQVFHREMKGGLHSDTANIALAAFVVISLIDAKTPNLKPTVLENAAYCLAALKQRHGRHKNDPNMYVTYTYALATLAQIKIEQYESKSFDNNRVENLQLALNESQNYYTEFPEYNNRQIRDNYSDATATENGVKVLSDAEDLLLSRRNLRNKNQSSSSIPRGPDKFGGGGHNALKIMRSMANRSGDLVWWEAGSLAVSIETTSYAILSLVAIGGDENWIDALGAVKWLSRYRNKNGGFLSTQDTLLALEAIYTLSKAIPQLPPYMNITVEGQGNGRHFTVTPKDRHMLHTMIISNVQRAHDDTAKLRIKASGRGCVLVQVTQQYNTLEGDKLSSPFVLNSKVTTDGPFNCKPNNTWCKCAAILEVCVSWNSPNSDSFPEMSVLEINMPSGYTPDKSLLYELIKKDNVLLRRIEENSETSTVYLYLALKWVTMNDRAYECFNFYLVGPKINTSPSLVYIYDYYHTDVNASQTYTINEACPYDGSRQPHDEPMDIMGLKSSTAFAEDTGVDLSHFKDWHMIDSSTDLNVPSGIEGNQPAFEMPPDDFTWIDNADNQTTEAMRYGLNENWTNVDFELDFPGEVEGVQPVWVLPPQDRYGYDRSNRLTSP